VACPFVVCLSDISYSRTLLRWTCHISLWSKT